MVKFFKYPDDLKEEVDKLVNCANDEPTTVKKDTTIYENNNRDKPFTMTSADLQRRSFLFCDKEVSDRREKNQKEANERWGKIEKYGYKVELSGTHHISDSILTSMAKDSLKNQGIESMSVWERIRSWLPGNEEARKKRIMLGIKEKSEE